MVGRLKANARTRWLCRALEPLLVVVLLSWSGLIDRDWYRLQWGRQGPMPGVVVAAHYVIRGRFQGLSPHPLFEPEYFDPKGWQTGVDPFVKFLRNPNNWNRASQPWFDPATYLEHVPQARRHRWGPLGHFVSTATADTPLPLAVPAADGEPLRWGLGRELLLAQLRGYLRQEKLRRSVRIGPTYDRALERTFLRRWEAAPVPAVPADTPVVSVVVPLWNRAAEVREAIASVQAQTLRDWELLVVDDGSTDESVAVVESIAATDARVKVLRQAHAGVSRARNLALEHAAGRYVAFLDSDNTYRSNFLRTAVAAMSGQDWRVAYAAMELRDDNGVRYRALEVGPALLALRNQVDLNVLVAERALVDEAGRFDESLKRTVDYDLVLRINEIAPIHYLPFVGAVYDHGASQPNRITNREPNSWLEVVQNNRFIDWESSARGRVAGRVSVLIPVYEDWRLTERCLRSLVAAAGDDDIEIVLVDNASRRAVGAILEALCAADPRITVSREPLNRNFGLGSNLAFSRSSGETVVFLNNDTEVQAGWLAPLRRSLENPAVLAAQPLLLYPDGTIQCAGVVFPSRGVFPVHFLSHHPVEDARTIGRSFDVAAVTGAALAMRADDVASLRGFDPIFRNGWEDVDLCLRLGQLRPGTLVVTTRSVVVHHEGKAGGRSKYTAINRALFHARWAGRVPREDEHLWQAAGFAVAHYQVDRSPGAARLEVGRPLLIRQLGQVPDGPGKGMPAFRWAIKVASPAGPAGLSWGDVHFAHALGTALSRLGQTVVVDSRDAHDRESAYLDDIVLVLRGLTRVSPQPGRVNLLWVISHPDRVSADEVRVYDAVFAAGSRWAEEMSEMLDRPVQTLLQCTDAQRFHPGAAVPDTGERVLFVGNSRNVFRPILRDAIATGADVAIYGTLWDQFVDRQHIRGRYLPNEDLAAAYRSAGVVLNDHWEDMRREGFISNRVFDATAAGARVVSDAVPGVDDLFGGLVQTYGTLEELRYLLEQPRAAFPAEAELLRLSDIVRRDHSFDARARTLMDEAVRLWKH